MRQDFSAGSAFVHGRFALCLRRSIENAGKGFPADRGRVITCEYSHNVPLVRSTKRNNSKGRAICQHGDFVKNALALQRDLLPVMAIACGALACGPATPPVVRSEPSPQIAAAPTLVFSPLALVAFVPARGKIYAGRAVDKRYLAIVHGAPKLAIGTIDAPIGHHPVNRQEMAVVPRGRAAHTDYKTLAAATGLALLAFHLHTGRTHQIRVHAKHLGHPLVGDPVYGEARWKTLEKSRQGVVRDFPRPALHAWRLAFAHPKTGAPMSFEAPVPEDLRALWQAATGGAWPLPS
jgi:hypothetical protein